MHFLAADECDSWLAGRGRIKPDSANHKFSQRIAIPQTPGRLIWWANTIASALLPVGGSCLLWITEWGIWMENLHLYYRLRQSYGDNRQLHQCSGHLFLGYEASDLASYLQVAVTNGWGGYLVTHLDNLSAFFSHDEFVDFFFDEEPCFEQLRQSLSA